jgi:hypothetical protein
MDTTIQAKLPQQLLVQAQDLVQEGWASDVNTLIVEALQRYVESHSSQVTATLIREDIEWGLRGQD